ncbi:ATP-binding protein [Halorubrum sp. GN12_10-3_MGM]|uniref:hybrid sensor histidine kinase/response regulator n=1 Tax=Halorubrum sp. GN12_10-3_MGM TaxID=2518113 RepID=UPI00130547A3|nr:ATP-binding protein [Halorubrum sp. GN12_10-3_MGM]
MSSSISVVHVDDDPAVTELTATYLQRHDNRISVTTATTATAAFDHITNAIDCVISDYEMPGTDGIELLSMVRAEYPDLPFILFTGKGSEAIASEAISAGVTDYLQKDTNVEQYTLLANRVLNAVTQRQAERVAETERQRFQSLFDELTQPAVEIEYDAGDPIVQQVNAAFEAVFSYPATDIVGHSLDTEIVPEEDQDTAAQLSRAFQRGEPLDSPEVTRQTQNGQREFLIQTAPFDDRAGGFVIYTDITERNRREQKLTALHDVAEELAACETVDAVCDRTVQASKEILSFDLSVVSLKDGDLLKPRAISEAVAPDGLAAMSVSEGLVGKTYRTGESYVFDDLTTVPEANPQGPYKSAISVPIGDHGTFQAVAQTENAFTDVDCELTELLVRHTENAIDRLHREQALERQTERVDQFAEILSHDLRNPLNVAAGQTDLLRDECDSDRIDTIAQAHERMEGLIETVLTLARDSGDHISVEPVTLADAAERGWNSVETADATLTLESERVVSADPSQLQQLFENMFRNAIEHSTKTVSVTVGATGDGFYIEDTGPGIPAEQREQIFTTGYSTTTNGTGLGLTIVTEIVRAHGWEIAVTDGTRGGTRFKITAVEFC